MKITLCQTHGKFFTEGYMDFKWSMCSPILIFFKEKHIFCTFLSKVAKNIR